jgi:hypothetical protein
MKKQLRHLKITTVKNCFYVVTHQQGEELAYFRLIVVSLDLSFFPFGLLFV